MKHHEGLMLKLKLQYSGHLLQRADSLEKTRLIRKYPDAGKDWRQEEKGTTEDEMVGWHNQPNGHEFEQSPGDSEGQGTMSSSVAPPPALSLSLHQGLFQWVALCIKWPNYSSFSFCISPSSEYSGFISFRIDWFDLFAVQGTLKSHLQHHSSKASTLQSSPSLWSNSHIRT